MNNNNTRWHDLRSSQPSDNGFRNSYDYQQPPAHRSRFAAATIDDYDESERSYDSTGRMKNNQPISISFRNNILDQCNDNYENHQRPSTSPTTNVRGGYEKSTPNVRKSQPSLSPYRRTQELSHVSPS